METNIIQLKLKTKHFIRFMYKKSDLVEFGSRLKLLISSLGLTQGAFAKEIGVNDQRISNIITRKKENFNFSLIKQTLERYPDLSAEWLCRGIGSMWKNSTASTKQSHKTENKEHRAENLTWRELVDRVERLEEEIKKK